MDEDDPRLQTDAQLKMVAEANLAQVARWLLQKGVKPNRLRTIINDEVKKDEHRQRMEYLGKQ